MALRFLYELEGSDGAPVGLYEGLSAVEDQRQQMGG